MGDKNRRDRQDALLSFVGVILRARAAPTSGAEGDARAARVLALVRYILCSVVGGVDPTRLPFRREALARGHDSPRNGESAAADHFSRMNSLEFPRISLSPRVFHFGPARISALRKPTDDCPRAEHAARYRTDASWAPVFRASVH